MPERRFRHRRHSIHTGSWSFIVWGARHPLPARLALAVMVGLSAGLVVLSTVRGEWLWAVAGALGVAAWGLLWVQTESAIRDRRMRAESP